VIILEPVPLWVRLDDVLRVGFYQRVARNVADGELDRIPWRKLCGISDDLDNFGWVVSIRRSAFEPILVQALLPLIDRTVEYMEKRRRYTAFDRCYRQFRLALDVAERDDSDEQDCGKMADALEPFLREFVKTVRFVEQREEKQAAKEAEAAAAETVGEENGAEAVDVARGDDGEPPAAENEEPVAGAVIGMEDNATVVQPRRSARLEQNRRERDLAEQSVIENPGSVGTPRLGSVFVNRGPAGGPLVRRSMRIAKLGRVDYSSSC
jgi:hypothetical protein